MNATTITYQLELVGPLLTRESGPGSFGVDASMVTVGGEPCIPHSLLKGRLREALFELRSIVGETHVAHSDEELFGEESGRADWGQAVGNRPNRGRLEFSDVKLSTPNSKPGMRHRISIHATLGSVTEGHLQVAEDRFGSGAAIIGHGTISFLHDSQERAQKLVEELKRGLKWMVQLGAGRTTGFGRLKNVVIQAERRGLAPAPRQDAPVSIPFSIRPNAPFCFTQHKIGGNLFESSEIIPGNAIKGAIAEMCHKTGYPKPQGFDEVRIRHAFPSEVSRRAQVAPLSIVEVYDKIGKTSALFDAARLNRPALIRKTAPAFRVDWKSAVAGRCDAAFGWVHPETTLRVRTAIDSNTQKARDHALFSQELIVPGKTIWRSVLDFSGLGAGQDRAAAVAEFRTLLDSGLRYLGKTKVSGQVQFDEPPTEGGGEKFSMGDSIQVTLQTPTLLADPRYQASAAHDALHACYAEVWAELSGGVLELSHFFASQSLAGGNYLWQRFQKPARYRPWFLTDAGSVFILRVKNGAAKDAEVLLRQWLAMGLPLPRWAVEEFSADWQRNPYLPQNGFGEIAVNIAGEGIGEPHPEEVTYV